MRIGTKLTASHLGMAMVPLLTLAVGMFLLFEDKFSELETAAHDEGFAVMMREAEGGLTDQAQERLWAVHQSKQHNVERAFGDIIKEMEFLSQSPAVRDLYTGMKFYHDFGGVKDDGTIDTSSQTYTTLYGTAFDFFDQFLALTGYSDVYLVCAKHGHVLFTQGQYSDLGQNLAQGELLDEGLGRLWQKVNEEQQTCLVDFEPYSPAFGNQAAFVGTPFWNSDGDMVAMVALQVNAHKLNEIVSESVGLGESGDSFLVGTDRDGATTMRSRWKRADIDLGEPKSGKFVDLALAGESGFGDTTNKAGVERMACYSPVEILGTRWALITSQDKAENLAAVARMKEKSAKVDEHLAQVRESARASVEVTSGILLVVFAALGALVAVIISRKITRPLVMAGQVADKVAAGDLGTKIHCTARDELGNLSRALDRMVDGLKEKVEVAGRIAEGDLTVDVQVSGPEDEFGSALRSMTERLSETMAVVYQTSEQVGRGAKEISDSSTSLSSGATEQAASLQEITSSMTELNSQVKLNAENAGQADQLSNVAREAASTGVGQMQNMTVAMSDISQSSEEISKIIKVIDDIAFQTNLLALNAAVEAARAGKHGKGFAVVAEEVRNLAGRSAKAARETAQLIEGSLAKVDSGTEIAKMTSTSLEAIVESVTKASDLVGEIAAASNEQAQGISEVSEGLKQIDSVTQANTASSEETASASQDLSSQAATLLDMLGRFQMRGVDTTRPTRAYPEAGMQEVEEWEDPSAADPEEIIQLTDGGWGV